MPHASARVIISLRFKFIDFDIESFAPIHFDFDDIAIYYLPPSLSHFTAHKFDYFAISSQFIRYRLSPASPPHRRPASHLHSHAALSLLGPSL